ncbi:MAG: metallophosphoesterase family protein [Pseudomonadota bacterium]
MPVTYAIGDVHGEAARLKQLHTLIDERHDLLFSGRTKKIVHLGDYVDRGRDSYGVIEQLIALQTRMGEDCICLRGNHEEMMLDGLTADKPSAYNNWLVNGGEDTVASYRRADVDPIPTAHIDWLKSLPSIHRVPEDKLIFVHAGINPVEYPNDREGVYLWTRARRFFEVESWRNEALDGWTVVHGHTPTEDFYPDHVSAQSSRLNLDTGAVFGGRLTAAIFDQGAPVRFIYA